MVIEVIDGIEIPNHTNELEKATEYIEDLKFKFRNCERKEQITDEEYADIYSDTLRVLYYVGDLSDPAFKIEDELEDIYFKMYVHSPELAKELFFAKYHEIHKPYNLLKNRCFTLLDGLVELYTLVHNCNPKEVLQPIGS